MKYRFRFNKKRLVIYLLFFIIFLFTTYLITNFKVDFFQYRGIPCIKYVEEGTLYGGQPTCEQGPVSYWLGYIFVKVTGFSNLQMISMIFIILVNILVLDLLIRFLKTKKISYIALIFFLYLVLIYPTTLGHIPTLVALYFVLLATFLIFETNVKYRFYFASVLLALAILSKFTSFAVVAAVLFVYGVYALKLIKGKLKIQKKSISEGLQLTIPGILVLLLAKLIYPHVYVYSFLSHNYNAPLSTFGSLIKIITTNPFSDINYIFFIFFMLIAVIALIKTKDKYALIYLVGYAITFIKLSGAWDTVARTFGDYHTLIPMPFFILAFSKLYFKIPKKLYRFFIILLFTSFIVYNNDTLHLYGKSSLYVAVGKYNPELNQLKVERDKIQEKIEYAFSFIPRNDRPILVDDEMYQTLKERNENMNFELVENRNNPPWLRKYLDTWYVPGLKAYGVLKTESLGVNELEIELAEEIKSGKFQSIFISPLEWDTQVFYALRIAAPSIQNRYCTVYLPTLTQDVFGRHKNTLLFDNISICQNLLEQSAKYYVEIFDEVCQKDQFAAEYFIKQIFATNNILINKTCNSGRGFIKYHDSETRHAERHNADIFIWPIVMLIIIYLLWTGHQKKKK